MLKKHFVFLFPSSCDMNRSSELFPAKEIVPEEFDSGEAVACVILGLSFIIGVPGNLLVIWTILRHIKQRSHTVVLILHLAVADLLVLITLPLWIYSLVRSVVFGKILCQAVVYIVKVCMFGSIFFITLMAVERFVAVCHPFLMMRWKTRQTMNKYLVFLWLLALLLGVPTFIQPSDDHEGREQCFIKEFSSVTQAITFLCLEILGGFIFPFIILIVCYCLVAAKLKKISFHLKHKSMLLVHFVIIAFTLCWLPYHVVNIIDLACILGSDRDHECLPASVVFIAGALVFISSSVNPVLYFLFASSFRESLEESRLVMLFKAIGSHSHQLPKLTVQQQTDQGISDRYGEIVFESM